jgi:hypothetical protein
LRYETGSYFRDGEFKGMLSEGRHWLFGKARVDVANVRDAWTAHDKLDMIVKSGVLKDLSAAICRCDSSVARRNLPPGLG